MSHNPTRAPARLVAAYVGPARGLRAALPTGTAAPVDRNRSGWCTRHGGYLGHCTRCARRALTAGWCPVNFRQLAALIRPRPRPYRVPVPDHAERTREELALAVGLADAIGHGLVRDVTAAGRAALTFCLGQISTALEDATAYRRLTDAEGDQ